MIANVAARRADTVPEVGVGLEPGMRPDDDMANAQRFPTGGFRSAGGWGAAFLGQRGRW
jgi:hypothetical protein